MCLRTAGVRLRLVAGRRLTKPSRSSFPGQLADAESGLNYNYFRDYDPSLGRYIESDPIGLAGGLNTYGYVGGNPVNYADPSGEIVPVLVGIVIGLEVSVAFSIYDNLDNGGWSCIDWTEVAIDMVLGVAIAEGIAAISRIPRWAARAARGGRGARPPFASGGRGGYGGAGRGGGRGSYGGSSGGTGPKVGTGGSADIPPLTKADQLALNKAQGDAFRDEIADLMRKAGVDVDIEVYQSTPFGRRRLDVGVFRDGDLIDGIETKTGGSRYTPSQRAKDEWLRRSGVPVTVIRDP